MKPKPKITKNDVSIPRYTASDLKNMALAVKKRSTNNRTRIETLRQAQLEAMGEYYYRRIQLPFKPPFLFDCRFNGAGEQQVQGRFAVLLDRLSVAVTQIEQGAGINVDCDEIGVDVLTAITTLKGLKASAAARFLESKRLEYVASTAARLGRYISSDIVRRMGLGDQVVVIGILQSVARAVGHSGVTVAYDPVYPGSRELFQMSGLNVLPLDDGADLPLSADTTLINMREHILEHPLKVGVPCFYGEEVGDPAQQVLWNMGWESILTEHKTGMVELTPGAKCDRRARIVLKDLGVRNFIAAQPLEATRGNVYATPDLYSAVIQRSIQYGAIVLGAGRRDAVKLQSFEQDMELPEQFESMRVHEPLGVWLSLINRAAEFITGNTSGMWLGFASQTPITILTKSEECHGRMWIPKDSWFDAERSKEVITIA